MSYNNSNMGNNPPNRTGLSVQELKQLTAMRMSQVHVPNDSKVRPAVKEVSGHPPRNPLGPQIPQRQVSIGAYQPPIEMKPKSRHEGQHSKPNKAKGRGRTSPVDTSFGSMPHGLTVQELKELTRIRLAREAMNNYSSEASDYSDTRTHTTSATFRSSYSANDVDSYSDSGSVPRNRSTSTSPTSNTDSDSFEEGLTRFPSYHHQTPIPISPSSTLSRSDRDRQIPSYSPENSNYMTPIQYNKSPNMSPNLNTTPPSMPISHHHHHLPHQPNHNHIPHQPNHNNNNININGNVNGNGNNMTQPKYVSGIHPGLHQKQSTMSMPQQHNPNFVRPPPLQSNMSDYPFHDVQISFDDSRPRDEPLPYHQHHHVMEQLPLPPPPAPSSTGPVMHGMMNQPQRSTSLISNGMNLEREPTNSFTLNSLGGNNSSSSSNLRKLALANTMSNLEAGPELTINSGIPTPPLNPLFPFVSPSINDLSPPGSPQRSFRGKKKLVIDCPAPVRIRSSSDCNELAFEMAEAVLNSPGPNSPLNGNTKPIWSDPPSRRTSICSVHSDTGMINGILHDPTGIGLTVPTPLPDHQSNNDPHQAEEIWKNDHESHSIKAVFPMSPVTRLGPNGSHVIDSYNNNNNNNILQLGGAGTGTMTGMGGGIDQNNRYFDGSSHISDHSGEYQWK